VTDDTLTLMERDGEAQIMFFRTIFGRGDCLVPCHVCLRLVCFECAASYDGCVGEWLCRDCDWLEDALG
jgi:hypothetical protein